MSETNYPTVTDPDYGRVQIKADNGAVVRVADCECPKGRVTVLVRVIGSAEEEAGRNLADLLSAYVTDGLVNLFLVDDLEGPLREVRTLPWAESLLSRLATLAVNIVGVDDLEARDVMGRAQQLSLSMMDKTNELFAGLKVALGEVLSREKSADARALFALCDAWNGSRVSLPDLSSQLLALADKHCIELPNEAWLISHKLHRHVDYDRVELELNELKRRIKETLDAGIRAWEYAESTAVRDFLANAMDHFGTAIDITRLHIQGATNRGLHRSANAFDRVVASSGLQMSQVLELARVLGIDLNPYQSLTAYARHIRLLGSVEPVSGATLLTEHSRVIASCLRCLESAILDNRQTRLAQSQRIAHCLSRLAKLELPPNDVDELLENLEEYRIASVVSLLQDEDVRLPQSVEAHAREFDSKRNALVGFYLGARKRATQMGLHTAQQMVTRRLDRAVLICLGYYVDAIVDVLNAESLRCVVIHPKFRLPS